MSSERRKILTTVEDNKEFYDILRMNINKKFPRNTDERVRCTEVYLKSLMTKENMPSYGSLKQFEMRGIMAEVYAEVILERFKLMNPNIIIMKNLIIPLNEGGTTQIDFIILSPLNIIVLEVKSIFGAKDIKDDIVYSEYYNNNGVKERRETKPWGQNGYHIRAIQDYVGTNTYMQNAVFLFGITRLESYEPTRNSILLTPDNMAEQLYSLTTSKKRNTPISENTMKKIVKGLYETTPTLITETTHIEYLMDKHK